MKTVNNVKIGFAFIVIIKTLISRSYVNANNVENVKNASFKICQREAIFVNARDVVILKKTLKKKCNICQENRLLELIYKIQILIIIICKNKPSQMKKNKNKNVTSFQSINKNSDELKSFLNIYIYYI